MFAQNLEKRMLTYETTCDKTISYKSIYICRIEIHNFKTLIHKFNSTLDPLFFKIMMETTKDLLNEFNCATAYCCKGEISLIFNRIFYQKDKEITAEIESSLSHQYGGNVEKIRSLITSYTSCRLLHNIKNNIKELENYKGLHEYVKNPSILLNTLIYVLPNKNEVVNYLYWRSDIYCFRNYFSQYCKGKIKEKELGGLSMEERIKELKDKGYDIEKIPMQYRYGVYVKRRMSNNKRKGKLIEMTMKIKFNEDILKFILDTYFEDDTYKKITEQKEMEISVFDKIYFDKIDFNKNSKITQNFSESEYKEKIQKVLEELKHRLINKNSLVG